MGYSVDGFQGWGGGGEKIGLEIGCVRRAAVPDDVMRGDAIIQALAGDGAPLVKSGDGVDLNGFHVTRPPLKRRTGRIVLVSLIVCRDVLYREGRRAVCNWRHR